jgi:plastocyanin
LYFVCAFAFALVATLTVACDDGDEGGGVGQPTSAATPAATEPAPEATTGFAPDGPTTFDVLAGAKDGAVDVEWFFPETIRIRAGDSITWTADGYEGHTITFIPDGRLTTLGDYLIPAPDVPGAREFNPTFALNSAQQGDHDPSVLVNSGYYGVPAAGTYTLRFPTEGVYSYLCMIHPLGMRGSVVVEPPGEQVPSPETVRARAEADKQRALDEALAAQEARASELQALADETGGDAHIVAVGLDTDRAQVVAFMPASLTIDAGDTVIFSNSDRDFHNVVFVPDGQTAPQFPIIKTVEGRVGFRLIINPDAEREIPPPPNFGPGDLFSSGLMGVTMPRFQWALTFDNPGRYRFECTVHTLAGMAGVLTVR